MLFHFLNFSRCVFCDTMNVCLGIMFGQCMFGHKNIYKVTNLKVHSKGRYFVFKKSLFKNYSERLVWTTKLFSCICDITKINPAYGNSNGWGVGRTLGFSEGNRLSSGNYGCHFNFILHVMSDKAAFVSGALVCVQHYRGNLDLSHSNSASRWQIINLHIYMPPQIV